MNKRILVGIGIATSVAVLSTALIAGAQTTNTSPSQPMILQVGKAGNVLMRGVIHIHHEGTYPATSSDLYGSFTETSWGGVWTVNISPETQVLPATAGNDISQFKEGDFVGVVGTVSQSAPWTIDATLVRDWTYRAAVTAQVKANVQAAQGIRNGYPRDFIGTAGNVSGSSLTLTATNGTAYTVDTGANTEIVNRNWVAIPFANIQNGNNVRVYGMNASGTVTAQIIRDVTL